VPLSVFPDQSTCRIGLCIKYVIKSHQQVDAGGAFHDHLVNGIHTLRTEFAPTDATDVRAFLGQLTGISVPPFELSIKFGEASATPQELISVSYCPRPQPSESDATPAEGILTFHAQGERLDALYRTIEEY
jgi:hypothetical protein